LERIVHPRQYRGVACCEIGTEWILEGVPGRKVVAPVRKVNVAEKVLIVEDEAHARTGLTELVASWGFRAECAEDGVEGLERVRQWSPGIVVTDLKMPRMDGMELLARVREAEPGVVVVMLTAQGSI